MGKKPKPRKIRTEFRKNREVRVRDRDLTRDIAEDASAHEDAALSERVSGKGALTRQRTVVAADVVEDESGQTIVPDVDLDQCRRGRVLSIRGLLSDVEDEAGQVHRCATRRLLKTLSTDQRHVVAVGDWVMFRPAENNEGIIERVEPRQRVISRTSRGRQHIIVANVDQMLIVSSAAEPYLKPNLIDRMLVTAEKNRLRPVICINKIDLVDPADLQPLVGVYGQMGYRVQLISAREGWGMARMRAEVCGKATVVVGQSGVGKSSLLNAIEPGLALRVGEVSGETQKGKHTTTNACLIPLAQGGYVVDTPGVRQFQLWDVIPQEVAGFYRDLRPYVSLCRFPDCTHRHEADCAVKNAVADGRLDARRYESYCQLIEGDG
ncbi:MAG: ribosome small subunit-dependent GTPase A [Planctomycetales bacterium]|nr:ribosome small subunit-dependent GTPase A [Planctomycetales bacterium]